MNEELEKYLSQFDRALGRIPFSERAEQVVLLKEKILARQKQNPATSLADILREVGSPQKQADVVRANRRPGSQGTAKSSTAKSSTAKSSSTGGSVYNPTPTYPPRESDMVGKTLKVFGLTLLLIGVIIALTLGVLVYKFTPLMEVDKEAGQVKVLGGWIQIDEKTGSVKMGETEISQSRERKSFKGKMPLDSKKNPLEIHFTNGQLELFATPDPEFRWSCEFRTRPLAKPGESAGGVDRVNEVIQLNLRALEGVDCRAYIPPSARLKVTGGNGQVILHSPHFHADLDLANGAVHVEPDSTRKYHFETQVTIGTADKFESYETPDALEMKIRVGNGLIKKK